MKVLITGVSGFLGRHLAREMLAAGHEVYGIRLDEGEAFEGVVEYRTDVLDRTGLKRIFAEIEPAVVVHLAALSHVGSSWNRMPEYFSVNVLGVENVLATSAGARFVFASSSEIYGSVPAGEQPIPEHRPPAPRNPYALTKAAGERLVLAAGGIVVRTFNLVGPGQETTFALPSFAEQLAGEAGREAVTIKVGNLEARRDFVHVSDGAEAFGAVIAEGKGGEIYNLGSGTAISVREALDRLIEISGLEVSVEVDPDRLRPVDVPLLRADASKLRELGWRPRRGVDQALRDLWRASLEPAPV